ncbi:MAG: DUF3108 domain-containing protein [Bacteroidales bacterium]
MNKKGYLLVLILLIILPFTIISQKDRNDDVYDYAWTIGEELTYRVYYQSLITGQVTAGEAVLSVTEKNKLFEGRSTYNIVGTGKSKGAFNFFYKVRDRFESYVDRETLVPYLFIRRTREGSYRKDDDVYFNQKKNTAKSRDTLMKVPENIHDFVSALYYARTVDLDSVIKNQGFKIDFFLDDSTYYSWVKYEGRETIRTKLGTFKCLKLAPMAATGKVFSEKYPMHIWVTDDENRVPVLAASAVIVGSVRMELKDYKGLKYPMSAKLE